MKPKEKKQRTVRSPEPNGKRAQLRPIGLIRSSIKQRSEAPKQGSEGAPDAWLEVSPLVAKGLHGLAVGDDIIVVTWLHLARRDVLKVHPRSDRTRPDQLPAYLRPARPTAQILSAFILSPSARSRRTACGSVPSKPSTERLSSTSNPCTAA